MRIEEVKTTWPEVIAVWTVLAFIGYVVWCALT